MSEEKNKAGINISQQTARGQYSNIAIVSHSQGEFVIDFALMMPGLEQPEVVSRIILTPEHAKRLLGALQDNISKFDNQEHNQFTFDMSNNTAKS